MHPFPPFIVVCLGFFLVPPSLPPSLPPRTRLLLLSRLPSFQLPAKSGEKKGNNGTFFWKLPHPTKPARPKTKLPPSLSSPPLSGAAINGINDATVVGTTVCPFVGGVGRGDFRNWGKKKKKEGGRRRRRREDRKKVSVVRRPPLCKGKGGGGEGREKEGFGAV